MIANPYEFLKPVTPNTSFVGRGSLVSEISRQGAAPGGMSYAVIGGRRFGKTSLLATVKKNSEKNYMNVISVFLDMNQNFLSPQELWNALTRELQSIVARRLVTSSHHISLFSWHSSTYQEFHDFLQLVLEKLPPDIKIVFLLDEVDVLLGKPWHEEVFNQLRTLAYFSSASNNVNLVMAGAYFYQEIKQQGSPLINILRPVHLESLTVEDLSALVNLGGSLPDEILQTVWDYSGGHPHLAQYLLYTLWETYPEFVNISKKDLVLHQVRNYQKFYGQNLHNWLRTAGSDSAKVYSILEQYYGEWKNEKDVSRATRLTMGLTNQILINLCFQGIVCVNPVTGDEYRAQGLLFREWFVRNQDVLLPKVRKKKPATTKKKAEKNHYHIQDVENVEIIQYTLNADHINGDVIQRSGLSLADVRNLFSPIQLQISSRADMSEIEKIAIRQIVKDIEDELVKDKPGLPFLQTRLENLRKMAPDILETVIATITNPISGFSTIAKKIAEKIKSDAKSSG